MEVENLEVVVICGKNQTGIKREYSDSALGLSIVIKLPCAEEFLI